MKNFSRYAWLFGIILTGALQAQDPGQFPKPQKEHEWLQQFVGEWDSEAEAIMAPGQPPMKCKGTMNFKMLGAFWVIADNKMSMMGMNVSAIFTCGYDAEKKKYVGTWIDSMGGHMWKYEGTVDESGKKLSLHAEGPNMMKEGKMAKYIDNYEFKSKDHIVLTSTMQGDDGKWVQFMTANLTRKK